MGKPVIGEVVVLPFPQTNLPAGKLQPALVVADLAGDACFSARSPARLGPMVAQFRWCSLPSTEDVWPWTISSGQTGCSPSSSR